MAEDPSVLPLWANWCDEVRELFKRDPEIHMSLDQKEHILTLIVRENHKKFMAIKALLPAEKQCNDITVKVNILFESKNGRYSAGWMPDTICDALEGNPLFKYIHIWDEEKVTQFPTAWVVMEDTIVQYPSDNLGDLWSYRSVLPAELAKDILGEATKHIMFCTDVAGKPIAKAVEGSSYNLPEWYNGFKE